jgi:hypothetical protein
MHKDVLLKADLYWRVSRDSTIISFAVSQASLSVALASAVRKSNSLALEICCNMHYWRDNPAILAVMSLLCQSILVRSTQITESEEANTTAEVIAANKSAIGAVANNLFTPWQATNRRITSWHCMHKISHVAELS